MSTELANLVDGLVRQSVLLADGAMDLDHHPKLVNRAAYRERLMDCAATLLAQVYSADAAAHTVGLRGRVEAEEGFAAARRTLGQLQHALSLLNGPNAEQPIDTEHLKTLCSEVLALLLAVAVALRQTGSSSPLGRNA
jgi:hypothetical protein